MGQGHTEPDAGRSTFLLRSGGAGGGRVLLSGFWCGADRYREPVSLPDASGMSGCAAGCPRVDGVLDFETPDVAALDNAELPETYGADKGVRLSLVYPGGFTPYPNRPRLEKVGDADGGRGFSSACGSGQHDTDHAGLLKTMFLRFPKEDGEGTWDGVPSLLVTYTGAGSEHATGQVFDIDGSGSPTVDTEQLKVTAYDASYVPLASVDSPEGTATSCASRPSANNYDAHGWRFSLRAGAGLRIKYVRVDFTGSAAHPTVGFDNFNVFPACGHAGQDICMASTHPPHFVPPPPRVA